MQRSSSRLAGPYLRRWSIRLPLVSLLQMLFNLFQQKLPVSNYPLNPQAPFRWKYLSVYVFLFNSHSINLTESQSCLPQTLNAKSHCNGLQKTGAVRRSLVPSHSRVPLTPRLLWLAAVDTSLRSTTSTLRLTLMHLFPTFGLRLTRVSVNAQPVWTMAALDTRSPRTKSFLFLHKARTTTMLQALILSSLYVLS